MPVLTDTENPPEFADICETVHDLTAYGPIAVARTLARREKSIAQWINQRNATLSESRIAYYLPMVGSRRSKALLPLFPGFIFIGPADPKTCDILRDTRDIFGFLFTDNQPQLERELQLIAAESPLDRSLQIVSRSALAEGDMVRISEGPLMGMEGKFVSNPHQPQISPGKFIVDLTLLGTVVSVEISPEMVEPIAA